MILDDPLPRVPTNPFDTPAWLDYLADHEPPDSTIDRLLEEESSIVAHELIRYALDTYVRLCRRANQARWHLERHDGSEAYWRGMLSVASPEQAIQLPPRQPGDPF